MAFEDIAKDFRPFHVNSLNVALHFITTPLGMLAVLGLTNVATGSVITSMILTTIYCASLMRQLPTGLWLATCACCLALVIASVLEPFSSLGPWSFAGLIVVSYVGQDFAHWITGEKTFQASYMEQKDWLSLLSEHTYYLLPLVLDSTQHMHQSFLSWFLPHNYNISCKLETEEDKKHIKLMRDWVMEQNPPEDRTSHWWSEALPKAPKESFHYIADCKGVRDAFHKRFPETTYSLDILPDMNEVYVACQTGNKANSDTVFYMQHVDGPYGIFPFCSVYRCMAAVSPNNLINTAFPLNYKDYTISEGDVVGFDYNREVHYIRHNKGAVNEVPRIVLKLHYVVYPKALAPFGKLLGRLTTRYNQAARQLFLNTIAPKTLWWRFMAKQVLIGTELTFRVQNHLGMNNVAYCVVMAALAAFTGSYEVFLYSTSFVHYTIYISTYYHREEGGQAISWGEFKRNALFWKSLALAQAGILYLLHFELDVLSLLMCTAGFGLSMAATNALGWDRTYFGWELGFLEPKFITAWPYGPKGVPHPMIVGGVLAWLGIMKLAPLRAAFPYLALGHIVLYLVHMAQEHMAIYATGKIQTEGSEKAQKKAAKKKA